MIISRCPRDEDLEEAMLEPYESDPDVGQVDALEGGTGHTTVVTTITRI